MAYQSPELEFSRPLDITRVPPQGSVERIAAEPSECAALAKRFGLPALNGLEAELQVSRWRGEGLKIRGHFTANLDQTCVVSLDIFRSTLSGDFENYFLPAASSAGADRLAIAEGDAEPLENGIVDMGEAVAEAVALALDPYPKKPGVTFSDVIEEEPSEPEKPVEGNPFADLARLKKGKG